MGRRRRNKNGTTSQETSSKPAGVLTNLKKRRKNGGGTVAREEVERLMRNRKSERKRLAEQKLLEGLRQIREKGSGINPLEHFAKGIWFETTPTKSAELENVHPLFRGLMESNRNQDILFLLSKILDQKTCFIQEYLMPQNKNPYAVLLNLRSVSKSTRDAIDKWFEDDFNATLMMKGSKNEGWKRYDHFYWRNAGKIPIEFKLTSDINKLNGFLELKKPMKIFQRDLGIVIAGHGPNLPNYFTLFKHNVTQALEQIGDQIWRLCFYTESTEECGLSQAQLYSILREWLQLLPNLKFLRMCFKTLSLSPAKYLKDLAKSQPFPKLQTLQRFDFFVSRKGYMDSLCDAIIAANRHIKMFNCDENRNFTDYFSHRHTKSLKLEKFCCGHLKIPFQDFTPSPNWKLKRLDLNITSGDTTINSFIKFLNLFPTLEVVFISIDKIVISKKGFTLLRLPNLQHFGLEVQEMKKWDYGGNTYLFFLQILLHSSKLESLEWIYSSCPSRIFLNRQLQLHERTYEEDLPDFRRGFSDLNVSHLWEAFPKLEHIHVKCPSIDVDEHEWKCRSFIV